MQSTLVLFGTARCTRPPGTTELAASNNASDAINKDTSVFSAAPNRYASTAGNPTRRRVAHTDTGRISNPSAQGAKAPIRLGRRLGPSRKKEEARLGQAKATSAPYWPVPAVAGTGPKTASDSVPSTVPMDCDEPAPTPPAASQEATNSAGTPPAQPQTTSPVEVNNSVAMPTAPSNPHQGAPLFTFGKEASAPFTPKEGWKVIKNRGRKTNTPVATLTKAKAKANALPPPGTSQAKGVSKEPNSYCPTIPEIKAREAKLRAFTVAVDREYQEKAAQQLQGSQERAALKECKSKANEQLARPTTPKKNKENKEKRKFDLTPQHMKPKRRSLEASKQAKAKSVTSTESTTSDVTDATNATDTSRSADGPASGTRSQSQTQQDVFIDATVEPEEEL